MTPTRLSDPNPRRSLAGRTASFTQNISRPQLAIPALQISNKER